MTPARTLDHIRIAANTQKALLSKGAYVLWLKPTQKGRITVGRIGHLSLIDRFLAYAGSAMGPGGLKSRLAHHLRPSPKPHWHIDYLKAHAPIKQIWLLPQALPDEHDIATALSALGGEVLSHFGASDCCCHSHLFGFQHMATLSHFRSALLGPVENYMLIRAIV